MLASFVNTSDGFTDCWGPFFQLFSRFGGTLRERPIYLNTERATYEFPSLNISSTRVWPADELQRPTWSECLRRGLEAVSEPYILYLQEDYFLTREIDSARLEQALELLAGDPSYGVIYLNQHGPRYTRSHAVNDLALAIDPPARYLASTQAAIWRKDALLSLVRNWENGWMFEIFGSKRATKAPFQFLTLRPEVIQSHPVFDYVYTGVMKGQWNVACRNLFAANDIDVDFVSRGWYQERGRTKSRIEVARKLAADPRALVRSVRTLL